MARKTLVQLVDDLDGSPIAEGEGRTVAITLDGASYELDLSTAHADELDELLEPYLSAARKVGRKTPGRATSSSSSSSAPKSDPSELQKIREWAKENGHAVSDRGRISSVVREAYDAAH